MLRGLVCGLVIQAAVIALGLALLAVLLVAGCSQIHSQPEQFTNGYDWRQPMEQR